SDLTASGVISDEATGGILNLDMAALWLELCDISCSGWGRLVNYPEHKTGLHPGKFPGNRGPAGRCRDATGRRWSPGGSPDQAATTAFRSHWTPLPLASHR